MPRYRKKTPIVEAIQFDGDVNKLIESIGSERVFVKPSTGTVFIQSFIGLERLEEGYYVIKRFNEIEIYSAMDFEDRFENVE